MKLVRKLKFFLAVIVCGGLLLTLFYIRLYSDMRNRLIYFDALQNLAFQFGSKSDSIESCSPLVEGFKQFIVKLDGQVYPNTIPLYLNESINFNCLNRSQAIKKIFVWNSFFHRKSYDFYGFGVRDPFVKIKCPVTSCELFNDLNRLNESDLVLVHANGNLNMDKFPKKRAPNQRWVFVQYESPKNSHNDKYSHFDNFFNLTSTYRINSDFPGRYEMFAHLKWQQNSEIELRANEDYLHEQFKKKSGLAAALISNCNDRSNRLEYIKHLQKFMPVSIFGSCGLPCPKLHNRDSNTEDCREFIAHEYKFYLSFENSICKDYITEKFFKILKYPIIPVVLGAGNYSYYVPKTGFIHTKDFKGPKELAVYLLYLSKNQSAYNSYFNWKNYVRFNLNGTYVSPICNMCINLHLETYFGIEEKVVKDIASYWTSKDCD